MNLHKILKAVEAAANRDDYPAAIADWFSSLYDRLTNNQAMIRVRELVILNQYMDNEMAGLDLIGRFIAEET